MNFALGLLLVSLFLGGKCGIYYMVQQEIPGHENQCYDEIEGVFRNFREKMAGDNGTCSRVTCWGRQTDYEVIVETVTCGTNMMLPPTCELVQDLSLPYPDCCPRIACPSPEGSITSPP